VVRLKYGKAAYEIDLKLKGKEQQKNRINLSKNVTLVSGYSSASKQMFVAGRICMPWRLETIRLSLMLLLLKSFILCDILFEKELFSK
jgi:hypothetical protein